MKRSDYWYLCTDFSKYTDGLEAAYDMALEQQLVLMEAGVPVFAPICHNYPVSLMGDFPDDTKYWMEVDYPFLSHAYGIIIVCTPDWEHSRGIKHELEYASKNGLEIIYMTPGEVPEEFGLDFE